MKVIYDPRVVKFLDRLNQRDRCKVREYILLFEEYGFNLDTRYLKKVSKTVWELRPSRIRLFLYISKSQPVTVHANYKKSQKIAKKDLNIIKDRIRQYI